MSQELTPVQKLDEVLKFLQNFIQYDESVMAICDAMPEGIVSNNRELEQILSKLNMDGFVEFTDTYRKQQDLFSIEQMVNVLHREYKISFEGKLFIQQGGYLKQQQIKELEIKNLETLERIRKRNEKLIVWGTWAVAIGAIGLVVWEMYKTFCLGK